MRKVDLTLEVVTPAFIGGAKPDDEAPPTAEWRAPSVRGQLRFWFRAVAGAELGGNLTAVRAAENIVFGSTAASSALIVRTMTTAPAVAPPSGPPRTGTELAQAWKESTAAGRLELRQGGRSDPVRYLGYGPFDRNALCLPEGATLALSFVWRREPAEKALFERALWAWLNLGGIGGRSRRGFGSLRCTRVTPGELTALKPATIEDLRAGVRQAFGAAPAMPPASTEWPTTGAGTEVFVGRVGHVDKAGHPSGVAALAAAGSWLSAFRRRYGSARDTRTGIGADYEWARNPGGAGAQVPDRAGFGLPLAFDRGAVRVRQLEAGRPRKDARRASPLLVHVARLSDGDHVVFTRLAGAFLPDNQTLDLFRSAQQRNQPAKPTERMVSVVGRFLEDLKAKDLVTPLFP